MRARALVVIAADIYVRNTVQAGAFDRLDDFDTYFVASARSVTDEGPLWERSGYLGPLSDPSERIRAYERLEVLLRVARRGTSRTLAIKTSLLPWPKRTLLKLLALPGLASLTRRWLLREAGRNPELHARIEELRPDVLIAPSGGNDPFVNDALRSARELGIPSLVLVHNWDGLTSKGALAVQPDMVAVWGDQAVEQAASVHGMQRERIAVVGAPSLDHYLRPRPPDKTPFDFDYALFAGCYAPFDEAAVLRMLDETIERDDLPIKLVYRPHPYRARRRLPDRIDEDALRHVVIDPSVREGYLRSFAEPAGRTRTPVRYPPLDEYPPLFAHASLVVCPLSTMMLEAALMGRPVLAIAYDDGVHDLSPAVTAEFDHFERVERLPGLRLMKDPEQLMHAFSGAVLSPNGRRQPEPGEVRYWIHHDRRPFGERMHEVVRSLA